VVEYTSPESNAKAKDMALKAEKVRVHIPSGYVAKINIP
jgi:hypothetical protein